MDQAKYQEVLDRVQRAFLPDQAAGINMVIGCHLTGEEGGDWLMIIRDQGLQVIPGSAAAQAENANLEITSSMEDALALYSGQLDPVKAYLAGRVHLRGDWGLAMKLPRLFKITD